MKILLLPSYFIPEGVSSPYISRDRNQAFANQGWNMVVYTPVPCRSITEAQRIKYRTKKYEMMYNNRMIVHRFNLLKERKNPILRAIRYFIQNIKQFNRAVFYHDGKACDVMLIASTPPTQGAMAALAKKINKKPFIYNLQDIFPDSLVGTDLAKKGGMLWKIGRMIENFTYRHADKIIVISEDFKRNIMAKGVPEEKIAVIYNWVDTNTIVPIKAEDNPLYDEFSIEKGKFTVVYAGNLGNAQNIFLITDAAEKMKDNKDVQFVIFGSNGVEKELRERIVSKKLDNVKLLPFQPFERISYVYSLGDTCIVACKSGIGGSAMPSKTWSIMSCGRPVLASFDEGELKHIVESNNCGIFTYAEDLDGFVSAIEKMSKDKTMCVKMGNNGRNFVLNNLTKEVGVQKYVEVIKSVVKNQ